MAEDPEAGRDERKTLLVVLGAGASHDCLPDSVRRDMNVYLAGLPTMTLGAAIPPVTQNLVVSGPLQNAVLAMWPEAQLVVDELRHVLPSADSTLSLEQALRRYSTRGYAEVKRQIAALRFYLRDLLWASTRLVLDPSINGGLTNYTTLVRLLLQWCGDGSSRQVVIVNFNYDLLLEEALSSTWGFDPLAPLQYLHHDRITVLKPHGSVQWHSVVSEMEVRVSDWRVHGLSSINAVSSPAYTATSVPLVTLSVWGRGGLTQPVNIPQLSVPALALPMDQAKEFVWPDEQRLRFESLIPGRVSRLLTIGWRGSEDHFLPLLGRAVSNSARALVVTGGDPQQALVDAERTKANLESVVESKRVQWEQRSSGFSALVSDPDGLESWLSEPPKSVL